MRMSQIVTDRWFRAYWKCLWFFAFFVVVFCFVFLFFFFACFNTMFPGLSGTSYVQSGGGDGGGGDGDGDLLFPLFLFWLFFAFLRVQESWKKVFWLYSQLTPNWLEWTRKDTEQNTDRKSGRESERGEWVRMMKKKKKTLMTLANKRRRQIFDHKTF